MRLRLIDLDGSLRSQPELARRCVTPIHDLSDWGPRIRLSCKFNSFRRFEGSLAMALEQEQAEDPALTLYGSGDFHHVSLALVRRLRTPCNLLILDKHPDWMRGIPVLHCGTWLYHAAHLPHVRRIFHIGGDLDFDNAYRVLAPWPELAEGKIKVFPAFRQYKKGNWSRVVHEPLRGRQDVRATADRVRDLLEADREDLVQFPLYISVDKDVLAASEAIVNWDSGFLTTPEIEAVLEAFVDASAGNLAGMDIVGDWSPVRVRGLYRKFLHWTEHPRLTVDPADAAAINERLNLRLIQLIENRLPNVLREGRLSA